MAFNPAIKHDMIFTAVSSAYHQNRIHVALCDVHVTNHLKIFNNFLH